MSGLPDAPWIREAEMYGMPPYDEGPDPVCPICGHECPETIFLQDGDVVGCENCIDAQDANDWAADEWERQKEAERDYYEELKRE